MLAARFWIRHANFADSVDSMATATHRRSEIRLRGFELPKGSGAVFSTCRRYRYALTRVWDDSLPLVAFIGLNPSTADETVDDPTIRRCMGFAKSWGYGSVLMVNLFAFRSTDPRGLLGAKNPIGPRNDTWLDVASGHADLLIAAWGSRGSLLDRDRAVMKRFQDLHCLGTTKGGLPRHPLYLRSDRQPVRLF